MIDQTLSQALQKEIPILTAQIRSLYAEFDKKFHLNGAKIPITFGMEPDLLGSYTRGSCHEKEHFHFSLLFIGYAVKNPLKKEDRLDLYKHEYALTGAAPTPYYKAGEALMKHNYEKKLRSPIHDRTVTVRDTYRREQQHRNTQNSIVRYEIGEDVSHPKFGTGNIEHVEQLPGSVRLHIRFGEELKVIDQKWLLRTKYKKS